MIIITEGGYLGFDPFVLQDSDWEEIHEGDMESEKDLLSAATATPFGRSAHEFHLEAMAKAYNEVWLNGNKDKFFALSKVSFSSTLLIALT